MKKIVVLTQGLSRIVEPICNSPECDVIGIIECAPRIISKYSKMYDIVNRLYHSIQHEVSLKSFAGKQGIPYFYMISSSIELENWIKELSPDLIVVYSMSQLLKENIYTIPRLGTINLHPSYLPEYRGPNPVFWTYYNMEKQGGVTVHFIDRGEDTGAILAQKRFHIPLGIKSPQYFDIAIGQLGVPMLLDVIRDIEQIIPQEQPLKSPTERARNLKSTEHKQIINWQDWNVERIWHILRGTEMWLNALEQPKGIFRGTRWIIDDYEKKRVNHYVLGQIYKQGRKKFVACRDGIIYLQNKWNIKKWLKSLL